ncbi:MAG: ArsA family ATPase [Microthrixaceae bacterium]
MRTLLFTGKGGVGKTTTAAATALAVARSGRPTVVMSTDPAHSLADSFGVELDGGLTEVAPLLRATQFDAMERLEEGWGEIREYLRALLDWAGLDELEAEELAVVPGMDELFALTDILTIEEAGGTEVLVVDCAPTAETIRLLSLPDVLAGYMDRAFPLGRRVTRAVGPILERLTRVPVADDSVFAPVERLYDRLDAVRTLLRDPTRSSMRLVVTPEKMVVAEARRTFTYLSLYGYSTDSVIVNRVLPDTVTDPWFDRWRRAQERQLRTIERSFAPLPVRRVELAATEVVGTAALARFAKALYGGDDPAAVLAETPTMSVQRREDRTVLAVAVPFVRSDEVTVSRSPTELLVTVGPYRRAILLPDWLRRRRIVGASVGDGTLEVSFAHE